VSGSFTHGPYSPVVGAILAVAVAAALVVVRLYARRGAQPRWYRPFLVASLLLAIGNYLSFGEFRFGSYMNEWDVTHYYLGTKYAVELGYDHGYEAIWLADRETGLVSTAREIRDLRNYGMVSTASVLGRADQIRSRFSPERWQDFCADVAWLKAQLPAARWTILTEDHGHNAPPTWTAAVGTVANLLPIRNAVGRYLMLLIDPALLLLALAAIHWAFGLEAAALVGVLLGTHYFFSWGHLKGSLVRTDFACFSIYAMCLLHKRRFALAGACAAAASCSRAFPVLFLIGPFGLLVARSLAERKLDRPLCRFLLACGATALAACLFAVWRFHGIAVFSDWVAKMHLHMTSHVHWTVGFRTIFNTAMDIPASMVGGGAEWLDLGLQGSEIYLLWTARVLLLLPALYFLRSLTAASAYGFSYLFMFVLVSPVYYYLMVLCLPMLYFAAEPPSWSRTLGLVWLLVTGALGYLLYYGWQPLHAFGPLQGHGLGFTTTLTMTSFVGLTVLHMLGHAARAAHRARDSIPVS
jgi:hypothetical protein